MTTVCAEVIIPILKTLRAYEGAIEQVRGMEGADNSNGVVIAVNSFWEIQRDQILANFDEAIKEIDV